ncbi:hypothetical protein MLD38_001364 [Melastoma candidum]|uniref:Uncharacterized protein n=1 Tax=Melastoma candidum TaxID=119954 RepID=A0ACB9SEB7_9MYRT|nr:hypothetical protein MLD38_001364 [Melastoma candidum]
MSGVSLGDVLDERPVEDDHGAGEHSFHRARNHALSSGRPENGHWRWAAYVTEDDRLLYALRPSFRLKNPRKEQVFSTPSVGFDRNKWKDFSLRRRWLRRLGGDGSDFAVVAGSGQRDLESESAEDGVGLMLVVLLQRCGNLDDQMALLKHKLYLIQQGLAFNGKRTKTARSQGKKFQVSVEQELQIVLSDLLDTPGDSLHHFFSCLATCPIST